MTTKIPGRKVPQGAYTAFVPAPLPPQFDWRPRLVRALSDADRLIGKLAGEGGRLPNPHVLMRPFVRREAVLLSKIEGTQATPGELLAANPYITAKGAAHKLRVAFTTAQRAIERLERVGILKQTGDAKRDRVWCAKELLDILEEPAHLKPSGIG